MKRNRIVKCLGIISLLLGLFVVATCFRSGAVHSWSLVDAPQKYASLNDVACTSSSACTAVGSYNTAQGSFESLSLAERWNGSQWSVQPTPNPTDPSPPFAASVLQGVACTSSSSCVAVGQFNKSTGETVPLAESWSGSQWSLLSTPNLSNGGALQGVTCTSASACLAVGSYHSKSNVSEPLAELWNGSSWSLQSTPGLSNGGALQNVSCSFPRACVAVGTSTLASGVTLTLAERWNGSTWSIQSTPNPKPAIGQSVALSGVSCVVSGACLAVGGDSSPNAVAPKYSLLAERLNGSTWSIQTIPNPSSSLQNGLNRVSCVSSSACVAVGYYNKASGPDPTLAESWNGKTWSIRSMPTPSRAIYGYLYGVACESSSACLAVGTYTNKSGVALSLAETWNGSTWSIQSSPSPS